MIFQELLKLSKRRIKSLNDNQIYELVESDDNSIVYKNARTETQYRLTKAQAERLEKALESKEKLSEQDLRSCLRQSKSWVISLLNQSQKFKVEQNPRRLSWLNKK